MASVISVTIYVGAAFGVFNSELFGFRLLPGVLWFFLLGSWLYDGHHGPAPERAGRRVALVAGAVVLFWLLLWSFGKLALPYNRETLIGVLLALPVLHLLARRPRRTWDENLGNLSYGLFLNHFLILWAVFDTSVRGFWPTLAFVLVATLGAGLSQRFVERPALAWRQGLRARSAKRSLNGAGP